MRCENGQARWCASSAPGFLKDLILRHLTPPLLRARFDLNAGNRPATAAPSCHFLLALRHALAPFIVIAREAFGRDRQCKDRKNVVQGKGWSVIEKLGVSRNIKKKKTIN